MTREGDAEQAADAALLRAAAEGDREALGALYDRHAPALLAVAQHVLRARGDAEDVVHDAFLEAWHRARYYDATRGSVRAWLALRVRSRALDRLRSAQRANAALERKRREPVESSDVPPAADRHDARQLEGLLSALPDEQRQVLELGYFEGCTCAEIAAQLGVPIGTVKSRLSRAVAALRTRMLEAGGEA